MSLYLSLTFFVSLCCALLCCVTATTTLQAYFASCNSVALFGNGGVNIPNSNCYLVGSMSYGIGSVNLYSQSQCAGDDSVSATCGIYLFLNDATCSNGYVAALKTNQTCVAFTFSSVFTFYVSVQSTNPPLQPATGIPSLFSVTVQLESSQNLLSASPLLPTVIYAQTSVPSLLILPCINFQWSINASSSLATSALQNAFGPTLFLLPGSLPPSNSPYAVTVTLSSCLGSSWPSLISLPPPTTIYLYVQLAPLVATIKGASVQLISASQTLNIDGSNSHDPNNANAVLSYQWGCPQPLTSSIFLSNFQTLSTQSINSVSSCSIKPSNGFTSSSIQFPPSSFTPSTLYLIALTVSSGGRVSSPAFVIVDVIASANIISLIVNDVSASTSALSLLRLQASTPNNNNNLKFSWSASYSLSSNPSVQIAADLTIPPLSLALRSSLNSSLLSLDRNLLASGATFLFTCSVVDTLTGFSGSASFLRSTTLPPSSSSSSSFTVTTSGTAFSTQFTLTANGWIDQQTQSSSTLKYSFSYSTDSTATTNINALEIPLTTSLSPSNTINTLLPPGSLVLILYVYSQDGYKTRVTTTVTVSSPSAPNNGLNTPECVAISLCNTVFQSEFSAGHTSTTLPLALQLGNYLGLNVADELPLSSLSTQAYTIFGTTVTLTNITSAINSILSTAVQLCSSTTTPSSTITSTVRSSVRAYLLVTANSLVSKSVGSVSALTLSALGNILSGGVTNWSPLQNVISLSESLTQSLLINSASILSLSSTLPSISTILADNSTQVLHHLVSSTSSLASAASSPAACASLSSALQSASAAVLQGSPIGETPTFTQTPSGFGLFSARTPTTQSNNVLSLSSLSSALPNVNLNTASALSSIGANNNGYADVHVVQYPNALSSSCFPTPSGPSSSSPFNNGGALGTLPINAAVYTPSLLSKVVDVSLLNSQVSSTPSSTSILPSIQTSAYKFPYNAYNPASNIVSFTLPSQVTLPISAFTSNVASKTLCTTLSLSSPLATPLICGFLDRITNPSTPVWSSTGCALTNIFPPTVTATTETTTVCVSASLYNISNPNVIITVNASIECSCNHLTEFALYAGTATNTEITETERTIFIVFAVIYFVLSLLAIVQLYRVNNVMATSAHSSSGGSYNKSTVADGSSRWCCSLSSFNSSSVLIILEHSCVFISAMFHAVLLTLRSVPSSWTYSLQNQTSANAAVLGILMLAPVSIMLFAYSLLVISWVEVCAASNTQQIKKETLRKYVTLVNVGMSVLLLSLFILLIVSPNSDVQILMVQIVSGFICAYSVIAAIVFSVFSCRLGFRLLDLLSNLTSSSMTNHAKSRRIAYRILIYGQIFSISFCISALGWGITACQINDFTNNVPLYTSIAYCADVIALITVMILYNRAVSDLEDRAEKNSKNDNSTSSHSSTLDRSNPHNNSSRHNTLNVNLANNAHTVKSSSNNTTIQSDTYNDSNPTTPASSPKVNNNNNNNTVMKARLNTSHSVMVGTNNTFSPPLTNNPLTLTLTTLPPPIPPKPNTSLINTTNTITSD